jgi:hypothetical protein
VNNEDRFGATGRLNKDSDAGKNNFRLLPTLILFLKFHFQKIIPTSWKRARVLSYGTIPHFFGNLMLTKLNFVHIINN